jgi:hypothetical protein
MRIVRKNATDHAVDSHILFRLSKLFRDFVKDDGQERNRINLKGGGSRFYYAFCDHRARANHVEIKYRDIMCLPPLRLMLVLHH